MLRINELRTAKGINMREAARLLNLPYTTYVGYEKGQREPTSEVLILLADFFETTVDYLVGRSDTCTQTKRPAIASSAPELTPDEADLLRKYRALDGSGRGRVRNVLDYEFNSLPGNTDYPLPKEA